MTNLTCQAREDAPFLKRFTNDWATKALAMQLLKNKRSYSYRRGYIDVPDRYSYLKNTAANRLANRAKNPQGGGSNEDNPRDDATDFSEPPGVVASGSKSKRAAPATAATQVPRKKRKTSIPDTTNTQVHPAAEGKGKQKARSIEVEDEDDEDDEDEEQDSEADSEGEGDDGVADQE